jgi:hypothetical protein
MRRIKFIKVLSRKILKGREHMGDLGIDGKIIFE